jgi:hypothetical protein
MAKSLIISTMPVQGKSTATDWVQWYKTLKRNLPNSDAKALWVKAWAKRGDKTGFNPAFRKEMGDEGIDIQTNTLGSIASAGKDVKDFFGSNIKIAQYAGVAVLIIIVGGAGLMIYNIAKNPIAAAKAGADLAASGYSKGAVRVR